MTDFDLIVLGLGGIGSGAMFWAWRPVGSGVAGIEQLEIGHDRGGSEDHIRIIRLSDHMPDARQKRQLPIAGADYVSNLPNRIGRFDV